MGYPVARVGNMVRVGKDVGKIITGAKAHTVDGTAGGGVGVVSNGLVSLYSDIDLKAMLGPNADDDQAAITQTFENGEAVGEETPVDPNTPVPENNPVNCDSITGNEPGSFVLAPQFTLYQLTDGTVFGKSLRAQANLTKKQIVCNLRNVAVNILVPFAAQFGRNSFAINQGFRHGGGGSQHHRGQAVDLQFRNKSPAQILAAANWCAANLPYDQCILERGGGYWIHLSYSASPGRAKRAFSIDTRPAGRDITYRDVRLMP